MKEAFPTAVDSNEHPAGADPEPIHEGVWGPTPLPPSMPTWSDEERAVLSKHAADSEKTKSLRADIELLLDECGPEDLETIKAAIARILELISSKGGSKDG